MTAIWTYNEFNQAGTDFSDISMVEAYDSKMQKFRNYKSEAEIVLNALGAGPEDILLEIGTGTGHFAIEAAKRCKKVCAADVSQAMIDYAKMQAAKENLTNIEWVNRGFLTLDYRDQQFDCVFTNAALHHLPDFWKMIAISNIYRSLKQGGRFMLGDVIFSCSPDSINETVDKWVDSMKSVDEKFYSETVTHVKEEFSTFSWIIEGMLERAGFSFRVVTESNNFMVYLCTKK